MPNKLPSRDAAWEIIRQFDNQNEGDPDVQRPDYVGPVSTAVLVAALKNLAERVRALENAR